uniref:hypothetical protein n=1 Tax=Clostridium sp. 12(A) TaxID=1163671 RepID=UPI00046635C4|nr:hypothetical protein [Clostridium sp. 12(A)]
MKRKTDEPSNVTVNINIFSNITLDGKSLTCIIVALISFALVASICNPVVRAEFIRLLISMASDC